MRQRESDLEAVNLLELVPQRTATWTDDGERVTIERPLPRVRGLGSLVLRLSFLTGVKRLRLDEIGSAVWRRLDGRTVGEVVAGLREEFGERCEPAEGRLQLYVGILRRERLIAFPGFDEELISEHRERSAVTGGAPPAATAPR